MPQTQDFKYKTENVCVVNASHSIVVWHQK